MPDFTHHDPRIWSQPWRFDPDRFGPERAEHKRHAYAFVPFGGGAHTCIGKSFAYMLAKVFLHQLLLRYRWRVPDGYAYHTTLTFPFMTGCLRGAADDYVADRGDGGMNMMGLPMCMPGQMMCCGDGICGGPENAQNCSADCP